MGGVIQRLIYTCMSVGHSVARQVQHLFTFLRRIRVRSLMADASNERRSSEEETRNPCNRLTGYFTPWRRTISAPPTTASVRDRGYWEGLPLEEKRSMYKLRSGASYVTLSDKYIKTWQDSSKEPPSKRAALDESDYKCDPELNGKISLWQGDITRLEIDAIVNAANNSLMGGGGVDGAIHSAAGHSLADECRDLDGCDTGDAKITCGHRLPAKNIIHTVGPVYYDLSETDSCHQLTSCYKKSLELALNRKIRSIAFPCISTGIYGFPNEAAATIALETVRTWLHDNSQKVDRIIFCVFLDKDFRLYNKLLHKYFPLEGRAEVTDNAEEKMDENDQPTKERQPVPKMQSSVSTPVKMPSDCKQETHTAMETENEAEAHPENKDTVQENERVEQQEEQREKKEEEEDKEEEMEEKKEEKEEEKEEKEEEEEKEEKEEEMEEEKEEEEQQQQPEEQTNEDEKREEG